MNLTLCKNRNLYKGEPGLQHKTETGVVRPVREDVAEQCVQSGPLERHFGRDQRKVLVEIPGHGQDCSFQPLKWSGVCRPTGIGEIVKMLGIERRLPLAI